MCARAKRATISLTRDRCMYVCEHALTRASSWPPDAANLLTQVAYLLTSTSSVW